MTLSAIDALSAWDKTFETKDFCHLGSILLEHLILEDTNSTTETKSVVEAQAVAGELRIGEFKIIRENESYMVGTHSVAQTEKSPSIVMFYAEQKK